jgi:hypothetical protein
MGSFIAVDFDGTVVTHAYPHIGEDIDAVPVLKRLVKAGHSIILSTMRSGPELAEAVAWFKKHQIPLFGVNENPTQKSWTSSPKVYAQLLIDDTALGCPLIYIDGQRPFVDWATVEISLESGGYLPHLPKTYNQA